jgi:hypothetical protein
MCEEPKPDGKFSFRLAGKLAIAALSLCLLGLGAAEYWTRRYAELPPPRALQARSLVPRAAIRLDSTAATAPQGATQQPAAAEEHKGSPSELLGPDYYAKLACYEHPKTQVEQKLIAKLGADYPGLSEILKVNDAPQDPQIIRQLLDKLLASAKSAAPEKKPTLFLAADAMAARLPWPSVVPPNPELQRQFNDLAAEGLTFTWVEIDGGWTYENNLLRRLWREYPASEEGGDAFVLLLRQGWDAGPCCKTGLSSFRRVIEQGEAFLSTRANSPHRQDVVFLVAQAYETWWSLSLVPEENREEGDPSPEAYRAGAAAAREKAIGYYSEIVAANPDGVEANCSRKPLALLKANEDTRQRRFYCYCD